MSKHVAVETALGRFYGRDCIYVDAIAISGRTLETLKLDGTITGELCSNPKPGDILYSLQFQGILALRITEFDSCHNTDGESCFDEVIDSKWIRSLGGKVDATCRHFELITYDHVFEVVCGSYEFEVREYIEP